MQRQCLPFVPHEATRNHRLGFGWEGFFCWTGCSASSSSHRQLLRTTSARKRVMINRSRRRDGSRIHARRCGSEWSLRSSQFERQTGGRQVYAFMSMSEYEEFDPMFLLYIELQASSNPSTTATLRDRQACISDTIHRTACAIFSISLTTNSFPPLRPSP